MKKIALTKEAEQGALLSLREYFQREREEAAVADAHALMSERIEELFALEKVPEHKDKKAL